MSQDSAIAIIGMSGVYAGAASARALWQNVLNKVDAVTEASADWTRGYHDPQSGAPNRIYTTRGGWLHDLARFEPREFGIMPNAVDGREPDHFLTLLHAAQAMADAGYDQREFDRERAGIVLGRGNNVNRGQAMLLGHGYFLDAMLEVVSKVRPDFSSTDLDELRDGMLSQLPAMTAEILPGIIPNVNTGIVANRLNLMGPNYIVDAACASVLVAVEQASRELLSGRCEMMLAGGVHAQTPPQSYMIFSVINALSRGNIRPFEAGASGTLLGEGCGLLVLKRLESAERDGDRIYAVIRGTGVASDGKAKGLFAPRKEGQVLALQRAYADAGVSTDSISLIEAHATGIPLGDRTEIESLTEVFGGRRGRWPSVAIGSVKSMISHAVPASGGASMIKTAFALHQKILPPTLCETPAAELGLERTPFYVNNQARPWIHDERQPRRAGVDAFGFGGINAHAVLEEYRPRSRTVQVRIEQAPADGELFLFAAEHGQALESQLRLVLARLEQAGSLPLPELALACASRAQGACRLALSADSCEQLRERLQQALDKISAAPDSNFRTRQGLYYGASPLAGKVCFLYPGEGAQYSGMLADLCMQFPQLRSWFDLLESCDNESRAALLFPAPTGLDDAQQQQAQQRLLDMDVASESLFAAGMGMHELLTSFGLRPDALLGHSSGENTAITAAGLRRYADRQELANAIRHLNHEFRRLDQSGAITSGTLLTLGALRPEQREQVLAQCGDEIRLAMDNCPNQLILFGATEAMRALQAQLSADGVICQALPFGRAYHTALFKPMADVYRAFFADLEFSQDARPLYSACSVGPLPTDSGALGEALARQWESPVRFRETLEKLYEDGFRVFVEVGPSSNLTAFVGDSLKGKDDVLSVASNSRRRSGIRSLHACLAQLHVAGLDWSPAALFAYRNIAVLDLDTDYEAKQRPVLNRSMPNIGWPQGLAVKPLPERQASDSAEPAPARPAATSPNAVGTDVLGGHFALMQEFLNSQARIMGLAPDTAARAAPSAAAATGAAVGTERQGQRFALLGDNWQRVETQLQGEQRISLAEHRFLLDHCIGAAPSQRDSTLHPIPVLPFTFSMELAAEAAVACSGREDRVVIAMEQARGSRWLAIDENDLVLRIVATPLPESGAQAERFHTRIFLKTDEGPKSGLLVFEAVTILAQRYPAAPAERQWAGNQDRKPVKHGEGELYRKGMFHGPRLQGVRKLTRWADNAMQADLNALPTQDYLRSTAQPRFELDPALLDAAGQLAGYYLIERHDTGVNCFPYRVARCEFFGPPPAADWRGHCRAEFSSNEATHLELQYDVTAASGQVLMRVSGWEDRVFIPPQRFYAFRLDPQAEFLSDALPTAQGSSVELRQLDAFADRFLEQGGHIWKRMLAHMTLTRDEKAIFYGLPAKGLRRQQWLLGRIAAKDAVRAWARAHHKLRLSCADIQIDTDPMGRPLVRVAGLAGQLPSVSISHSQDTAVAALAPPGQQVGTDYQPVQGFDLQAVSQGACSESEQALLEGVPAHLQQLAMAAIWAAKEAAAKCAGSGLLGRPADWVVQRLQLDRRGSATPMATLRHQDQEYQVHFSQLTDTAVIAVCSRAVTQTAGAPA